MGCDSYYFGDTRIMFEEMNDDVSCLCTFPHNNRCFDNKIGPNQLRSLAYLGAMMCLINQREYEKNYAYIPSSLPEWIKEEIDRQIFVEQE